MSAGAALERSLSGSALGLLGCSLRHMNPLKKLLTAFRPTPKSPEDIAAEEEAKRLQDQNLDVRLSQRSSAGQNYQSGRGSR
jgi:hypothetical protein